MICIHMIAPALSVHVKQAHHSVLAQAMTRHSRRATRSAATARSLARRPASVAPERPLLAVSERQPLAAPDTAKTDVELVGQQAAHREAQGRAFRIVPMVVSDPAPDRLTTGRPSV